MTTGSLGDRGTDDRRTRRDPRDRRDDGRPEQSRSRDRTGRPLPYGTEGIELAEPCVVTDLDQAVALGVERWNAKRYFEAHELLELVWKDGPDSDRELWKGIIQVAVAGVHLQRGNPEGARRLLDRALQRLEQQPAAMQGIDVESLRSMARARRDVLRDGHVPEADLGLLPALSGGTRSQPTVAR